MALLAVAGCSSFAPRTTRAAPTTTTVPATPSDASVPPASSPTDEVGPLPLPTPPVDAVLLAPGMNVQEMIDSYAPGTTFVFQAGLYRLADLPEVARNGQAIVPKSGDTLLFEPGAVLDGSKRLTGWLRSSSTWYVDGQTWRAWARDGVTEAGWALSKNPEEVFFDGAPLRAVTSPGAVQPGTFFFDYAANQIHIGSDPTGHVVETAAVTTAIEGNSARGIANNVTVRNATIQKFATPASYAAIEWTDAEGWVVENNEIRLNHAWGIKVGSDSTVAHNDVHDNGQGGIAGYAATDTVVAENVISLNNRLRFSKLWEAGGIKVFACARLTFRSNQVHDNAGFGIWSDYCGEGVTYDSNVVERNANAGIAHEASFSSSVQGNRITGNGTALRGQNTALGAGVLVYSSRDVEIRNNVLAGNVGGVIALQQERDNGHQRNQPSGVKFEVFNLNVHDNDITMTEGVTGMFVSATADYAPNAVQTAEWASFFFTTANNRFEHNAYHGTGYGSGATTNTLLRFVWGFAGAGADVWAWTTPRYLGWNSWRGYQDADSSLV